MEPAEWSEQLEVLGEALVEHPLILGYEIAGTCLRVVLSDGMVFHIINGRPADPSVELPPDPDDVSRVTVGKSDHAIVIDSIRERQPERILQKLRDSRLDAHIYRGTVRLLQNMKPNPAVLFINAHGAFANHVVSVNPDDTFRLGKQTYVINFEYQITDPVEFRQRYGSALYNGQMYFVYVGNNPIPYLGVGPKTIETLRLEGTTVVLSVCLSTSQYAQSEGFIQAFEKAGAAAVIGWSNYTAEFYDGTAIDMFFDRFLGRLPGTQPGLRPATAQEAFDSIPIEHRKKTIISPLDEFGEAQFRKPTPHEMRIFTFGEPHAGAIYIKQLIALPQPNGATHLRIIGIFPPDPSVKINGESVRILSAKNDEIIVELPDEGIASFGEVVVAKGQRTSNPKQLTEWSLEVLFTSRTTDGDGVSEWSVRMPLRMRLDVTGFRSENQESNPELLSGRSFGRRNNKAVATLKINSESTVIDQTKQYSIVTPQVAEFIYNSGGGAYGEDIFFVDVVSSRVPNMLSVSSVPCEVRFFAFGNFMIGIGDISIPFPVATFAGYMIDGVEQKGAALKVPFRINLSNYALEGMNVWQTNFVEGDTTTSLRVELKWDGVVRNAPRPTDTRSFR